MKITCEVIQDLLPLYVDDAVSGDSRALVEEHLQNCSECRKAEEQLRAEPEYFENIKTQKSEKAEDAEVIRAFLKVRRSIWRKRLLSAFIAAVCVLAAVRGWQYFYYEKKTYLSLEESGLEMRGDQLYATKTYYGRVSGIVAPDQKTEFLYCFETPEIRKRYPSKPCELMITDFREPFEMTDEELAEKDRVRIERVYYLPEDFDPEDGYKDSDYDAGNEEAAAERTELLESISTLLWDVENGAGNIGNGVGDVENSAGNAENSSGDAKIAAEGTGAQEAAADENAQETAGTGFVPPKGSHINSEGNIVDPEGNTFNSMGQWQVPEGGHVDSQGRIIDKNGRVMGGGATVGSVG